MSSSSHDTLPARLMHIQRVNELLAALGVERSVSSADACSPSMFVVIFEKMIGTRITSIIRPPITRQDHLWNSQQVIESVEQVVGTKLPHISKEDITDKRPETVFALIDIMYEIYGVLQYAKTHQEDTEQDSAVPSSPRDQRIPLSSASNASESESASEQSDRAPEPRRHSPQKTTPQKKQPSPQKHLRPVTEEEVLSQHPLTDEDHGDDSDEDYVPSDSSYSDTTESYSDEDEDLDEEEDEGRLQYEHEVGRRRSGSRDSDEGHIPPPQYFGLPKRPTSAMPRMEGVGQSRNKIHQAVQDIIASTTRITNSKAAADRMRKSQKREAKTERLRESRFKEEQARQTQSVIKRRRDREETMFRRLWEDVYRLEKERLLVEQATTKAMQRRVQADRTKRRKAQEHFYREQVEVLREEIETEIKNRLIAERAQKEATGKLVREMRSARWQRMQKLRDRMESQEEKRYLQVFDEEKIKTAVLSKLSQVH
jgi:hypothetical protein